jgi:type I restriction-modification system DNA methylase subunit
MNKLEFQTPLEIAEFMCSIIPAGTKTVLEPTPGEGNIVKQLSQYQVTAPDNFFELDFNQRFDCIVMNPPFSSKSAYGIPEELEIKGMRLGYYILTECMKMSDHVIALMPWFTISDSDVRLRFMKSWGLKSLTALPRKTFQYARIQTCIFELYKGWKGDTIFQVYDLLNIKDSSSKYHPTSEFDASDVSKQIGCGYCMNEKECSIRDPKVNKAKQGCPEWKHHSNK